VNATHTNALSHPPTHTYSTPTYPTTTPTVQRFTPTHTNVHSFCIVLLKTNLKLYLCAIVATAKIHRQIQVYMYCCMGTTLLWRSLMRIILAIRALSNNTCHDVLAYCCSSPPDYMHVISDIRRGAFVTLFLSSISEASHVFSRMSCNETSNIFNGFSSFHNLAALNSISAVRTGASMVMNVVSHRCPRLWCVVQLHGRLVHIL
jgi:hypothetical protein